MNFSVSIKRLYRNPQSLWDDAATAPGSLGCLNCVDRGICGGAHKGASFFDCNDYCRCSDKTVCDLVCRGNPALYVERLREVGSLDLMSAPRAPVIDIAALPGMVPLIEHNSTRRGTLHFPIIAVSLYRLVDLHTGAMRFPDREALAKELGIDPDARLVVSGVHRDRKIERYWALPNRPETLAQLQKLDVCLVTPPNFSVLTDVPRTDNLHAMKRIMLAFAEMAQAGLPTALHVNARTERDYARWAEVIAAREEISCIATEFATGAGRGHRIEWHVDQLQKLAQFVGRPLRLVMRGGTRALEPLRSVFNTVTVIDTDSFNKTRCRKEASFTDAGKLVWHAHPTAMGEPLDDLLQHNVATLHSHHTYLERLHSDHRLAASTRPIGTVEHGNRKAMQGRYLR
ncbi:DUF4417 domain-containing protein [uncultured Sphingomonas sp.]|uniref:DUF4417 domain-containing protein n=1 Tax=uncultured Sphingomonas sp. TaxID=158754 RepID=UPI00259496C4|nr:DUF4417 domain-containing protein [uncultured Sphingomonas sp.]